jgi:hypothetical protein
MADVYATPIEAVVVPSWVPLGSVWVTQTPLLDPVPNGPGLAHLSTDEALAIAERLGARLPTTAEILLLHEVASAAGTELEAYPLPDAFLRAQRCVPGDARMSSRDWCDRHDAHVIAAITALGDLGDRPIANAGKHWRGPPPPGLAGLTGWWVPNVGIYDPSRHGPGFIQQGTGFPHNRGHRDYGSTCVLVRDSLP